MSSKRFYVYILQSLKDFSFYVGQCDDLDCRMSKHFDGMSKYSSSKRPLRMIYFETFLTRSEALKREREIKKRKARNLLKTLFSNGEEIFVMVEEVPTSREKVCLRETVSSRCIGTNPLVSARLYTSNLFKDTKFGTIPLR